MSDELTPLSRRQKQDLKRLLDALARVADTDEGRLVLRWIIERSGVFLSSKSGQFDAGRRELGLEVIRTLDAVNEFTFAQLMAEGAREVYERKQAAKRGTQDAED